MDMEGYGILEEKSKKQHTWNIVLGIAIGVVCAISIAGLVVACKNKKESLPDPDKFIDKINNDNWSYNPSDNVYYQIGIIYCKKPPLEDYERLSIFIPGEYMDCDQQGAKYSCSIKQDGKKGKFTSKTAPIVFPVETPGYMPCPALTEYPEDGDIGYAYLSDLSNEGIIAMYPGLRGNIHGAPLGVVDMKAAVAYIRHQNNLPGDKERIFSVGMSGGGAQSCLMGVTGDNEMYRKYMDKIGAVNEKDHLMGSYCYCPITNLDTAGEAYEWNMGLGRNETDENYNYSKPLAKAYAKFINDYGFYEGNQSLTLEESEDEFYQKGTYYDFIKKLIEHSFENYAVDTEFPTLFFDTLDDYLEYLNEDLEVISYDKTTKKATLKSIENFAKVCKVPGKGVFAFDDVNLETPENMLFGGNYTYSHFDIVQGQILGQEKEYEEQMKKVDALNNNVSERLYMYTPLNYLHPKYKGYNKSKVAKYFRIRSGLFQPDLSIASEANLYLALKQHKDIKDVDYETVWLKYHTTAERTGDEGENLIAWIKRVLEMES